MAPLGRARRRGICRLESVGRAAPLCRPLVPPLAGRATVKGDRTRRDEGVGPALGYGPVGPARWVLYQDPPADGLAGPPAGNGPVSWSAPRVGLLHRPDRRSIGPSASRTASEAARKDLQDGPVRPPTLGERRYRDRNTVERCVGHLKERRRLVVRYEKKVSHSRATASSHDPLGVRPGIPEQIIIRRSLAFGPRL